MKEKDSGIYFISRKVVVALQSLGFGEGCDDEVMAAVRDRVKKLCEKDNMLLHVLADSKSELDMYLRQQQDKAEVSLLRFITRRKELFAY